MTCAAALSVGIDKTFHTLSPLSVSRARCMMNTRTTSHIWASSCAKLKPRCPRNRRSRQRKCSENAYHRASYSTRLLRVQDVVSLVETLPPQKCHWTRK
ncbi:hypothetical protein SCLCIDRAFT_1219397 [Scleroderma citrinum Foug A]|uniref:Uncharacterized protein n=1 Tax=Scleroderma citrinum Foug A TaxID=1036808 RepID=A0A0C3DNF7_9AGAM|nr:hypothetical protein SCLCIDRAFT_1219397 [Scleroderma citrinum Foug A]